MAENLRRGYAKPFLFKSWNEVLKISDHLHNKNLEIDSDIVLWHDSDSGRIYRSEKINNTGDWSDELVGYKDFSGGFNYNLNSNLLNAYNLKTYFEDKDDIYAWDKFVVANTKFFLFDSEGPRIWTARFNSVGNKKSDFTITTPYNYPAAQIDEIKIYDSFRNVINTSSSMSSTDFTLVVKGQNFVTTNQTQRVMKDRDFYGDDAPIVWARIGNQNLTLLPATGSILTTTPQNKVSSFYNCNGNYVEGGRTSNSQELRLRVSNTFSRTDSVVFHYVSEFDNIEFPVDGTDYDLIDRAGYGFFVTSTSTNGFTFTTGDSDVYIEGLIIGGGGSGGDNGATTNAYGGGGGGGGAVVINSCRLPANRTYRIRVGSGGAYPNNSGASSSLRDMTTARDIAVGGGGSRGEQNSNLAFPTAGGAGGTGVFSSHADYQMDATTFTGGRGGDVTFTTTANGGGAGININAKFYSSETTTTTTFTNFIAGGGGGAASQGQTASTAGAQGGSSAGDGYGHNTRDSQRFPVANRGGGGGGAGSRFNPVIGGLGSGGSAGYAYIIFK